MRCSDGPASASNLLRLSSDCERLLERAMQQQGLSARAQDRILNPSDGTVVMPDLRKHAVTGKFIVSSFVTTVERQLCHSALHNQNARYDSTVE